uniref:RNA helicase n=1 Tax=Ditylenchus dipsaci TaxID=166011 RepID=A0A915E792_9BILA
MSEYIEKFRNFTDLTLCAEKLVYNLFGKADMCMKRVKTRGEYTVYEISATLQFLNYANWHGKIRIPGLMATGVITCIDTLLNKIEVVFKDFDVNVDPRRHFTMELIYEDFVHFGTLKTLWLLEQSDGLFAVYPNAEKLPDPDQFKAKCNAYANSVDVNVPFNRCQKQAIYSIVNGVHGSVPFILWGPPGTGKTVTLVECVRQLLKKNPKNRILICTPSNTAADLMALKILESKAADPKILRRYYALGKHISERNSILDNVTCMENINCFGEMIGIFSVDNPMNMTKYRVFVTTLVFCSNIEQIEPGFFSHIFVDEAAQSIEPETLIPITRFATEDTRVVLSGDHQQLGAVITTQFLNNHFNSKFKSCAQSLMERLMTTYNKTVRTTCRLRDTLTAVSKDRNSLCKWKHLPNKNDFPIIFHLIDGATESREMGSTSCANLMEVDVTVTYVELLLKSGVKPKDIGVVSPYKNQTRKIREKINPDITVDSVERYQGSERRVIIATTARTESIGFLGDNKRVNTLITRAMDLLIVVTTDMLILKMAESPACQFIRFLNFFHYCKENRAVTGHIVNKDQAIDLDKRLEKFGYVPHNQKLFRKYRDYSNTTAINQLIEDHMSPQTAADELHTSTAINNTTSIAETITACTSSALAVHSLKESSPFSPDLDTAAPPAAPWLFSSSLPCSPSPSTTPDFSSLLSATVWPAASVSPSTATSSLSTHSSSTTTSSASAPVTFDNIFQPVQLFDSISLPLFQQKNGSAITPESSTFAEMLHDLPVDPEIPFSKKFAKMPPQTVSFPLRSLDMNEKEDGLKTSRRQTTASKLISSKLKEDLSSPRPVSSNSSPFPLVFKPDPEMRKALLDSSRQFSALLQSDVLLGAARVNGNEESRKQEILSVSDTLKRVLINQI